MKLLRILFCIIFAEAMRNMILESVTYSRMTYERRGDKTKAAATKKLEDFLIKLMPTPKSKDGAVPPRFYSQKEVDAIILEHNKKALDSVEKYQGEIFKEGFSIGLKTTIVNLFQHGIDFSELLKHCEECEAHTKKCETYLAVKGISERMNRTERVSKLMDELLEVIVKYESKEAVKQEPNAEAVKEAPNTEAPNTEMGKMTEAPNTEMGKMTEAPDQAASDCGECFTKDICGKQPEEEQK